VTEDDWEDGEREAGEDDGRRLAPPSSLAIGFLALVPLLASYEAARVAVGGRLRSTSELLLGRFLAVVSEHETALRIALVAVASAACLFHARRQQWRVTRSLMRAGVEGLVGAVLLGPVLLMLVRFLGDRVSEVALPRGLPADVPDLARMALVTGSAAWEELLFRLGVYSGLFVVARRAAGYVGAGERVASPIGDGVALVGSSLVFAAAHLDAVVGALGGGGEPFHSGLFAWRVLAGACLGLLYRWRGLGVAAWTHALFNAGLILGAGPAVLL
jgi:hypothetical protein